MLALVGCTAPAILVPEANLLRDVRTAGGGSAPTVALTFDDGPNGRCTEAVLDTLAALRVPATFFVLGANIDGGINDALLARMVREGHTIGVHGYYHSVRRLFWSDLTADDLERTRAAISRALLRADAPAPPVTFFRPPFGFLLSPSARAAQDSGFTIVEWSIGVEDWRAGRTPGEVTDAILARVHPGDIILLHDGDRTRQRSAATCVDRPLAADALWTLVPELRLRGLEPAPLASVLGLSLD